MTFQTEDSWSLQSVCLVLNPSEVSPDRKEIGQMQLCQGLWESGPSPGAATR